MNQRIEQLAEQAKFMAEEDINRQISYNAELKAFAEKFAELIVKECMELVSTNRDLAIEDGWNVDEAMSIAINDIEEHFGVE
jgi:hypothetical protein